MKNLRKKISDIKWGIKWTLQSRRVHRRFNHPEKLDVDKCLILAPHADDELIGCQSVIYNSGGVVYMNFSANDADSEIRINEISNYCTSKRTPLIKLDYPPQDSALQLRDLLKPDSFSQIFLPCYIDWHPEHRATNQILRKVIEELSISPNIIWYQVSLPLPELLVNSYMLLSRKRHNNKWREFNQYYKSQKFLPSKRFIAIEKITGNALGHHAAEVFIKMTSKQWLRQIEQIDKLNLDYTNPKYHLNDIEYTTKWVDSIKFQL